MFVCTFTLDEFQVELLDSVFSLPCNSISVLADTLDLCRLEILCLQEMRDLIRSEWSWCLQQHLAEPLDREHLQAEPLEDKKDRQ